MEKLNKEFIILKGLEGHPAIELNIAQKFFFPKIQYIDFFWWGIWIFILIYVTTKYLLKPLLTLTRKN